ncbi:hypothetical protein HYFRA_00012351 [Hymenoscyphus fraxineus]|uniref:Rapid response to glucose protein 1 n=1 Tax=Hymenoscyphus fraxineus TaxID=746836 RepID=A0A9N9L1G6_9HELO|nr:hypothetical protein HYFRA_00012351 [Hymenoscyphus fraxineus]
MGLTSINVLDLPRLRDEPSFETLVQALEALTIKPSLWSGEATPTENTVATSRYLTSILSSGFEWFQDPTSEKSHGLLADEQREFLWNLASVRITERCGRSAQGELTRTWTIPANENHPDLNIIIREPPLTGDNLGHKTWGTAWAIAQKLSHFHQYFSHILSVPSSNPQVLELGSGTGLLGLAAALVWKTPVILTDLPSIHSNLLFNTYQNTPLLESRNAVVTPEILDWTSPSTALQNIPFKEFPVLPLSFSSSPTFC